MNELILKEREIKEKLVEIINTSNLPAFILQAILKDLLNQINIIVQKEYSEAKKEILKGGN